MKGFRFEPVARGVWRLRLVIVNLYAVEADNGWVLVDTGPPGFASTIQNAAYELFGDREPSRLAFGNPKCLPARRTAPPNRRSRPWRSLART